MAIVTIEEDGCICVGGASSGFWLVQTVDATEVRATPAIGQKQTTGELIPMPRRRYALSTADGRAAFDQDFLAAYSNYTKPREAHPAADSTTAKRFSAD